MYKIYDTNLNFTHISGTNKLDVISGLYLNDDVASGLILNSSNIIYPSKSNFFNEL